MEAIVSDSHFQSQLSSIMEMLAKTAVAEIGKLVEQSHAVLRLEISRQVCENETLKNKCELLESELKAARRRAQHAATEAQHSGGLRDAGHRPTIDGVFGKEWCMDLWKEKESVESRKGDTHADSCLPEPVDLMDDEPDMIIIKDESFEDGSGRNKLPESSGSGGKACATMEAVRGLVSRTLPLLPGEILDKVTERLEEIGVSQKEDLHLVTTEDLKGVLKPLHCRKLIKAFSAGPLSSNVNVEALQNREDFITYTIPLDGTLQRHDPNFDGSTPSGASTSNVVHPADFGGFYPSSSAEMSAPKNQTSSGPEQKKLECVFCGKNFNYFSYLKVHLRTHSGEKPFGCTLCGKRFAQKTYLKIHLRTHSGERPYTCVECGKSFSQKSSLNIHLRSHTGEKPYSCVDCGKRYAYKHGFNSHQCSG